MSTNFLFSKTPKLYLLSTYSVVPFSLSAVDNQVTVPSEGCAHKTKVHFFKEIILFLSHEKSGVALADPLPPPSRPSGSAAPESQSTVYLLP